MSHMRYNGIHAAMLLSVFSQLNVFMKVFNLQNNIHNGIPPGRLLQSVHSGWF